MILDQNYRNIADLTSKVFRLYARRVFAEAVKDTYEKRKLLGFDKGGYDEMKMNQFNPSAISGIVQNFPEMSENNDENQFKRTLKSISSLESHEAQKQAVYQLFYGDLVFILKVQDHINDIEEKLFMGCEMNNIQGCRGLRGFQINMRKYLFKLIHPHEKFGIVPGPRTKFTQNSPVCLMNIQTGKYIKLIRNQIPKKVLGFKISLSDTITSDTVFLPVKTGDKFIQTSKQIFTSSYFKLILRQNNYFKLNVKEQDKIALTQTNSYTMLANYDGCELSFLKQNIQAPNKALIQNPPLLLPETQPIKCYKSYYIRSDTGFYLASQERKTSSGMKQITYNMFSEGIGRYNVIVDQFTNPSIQVGDISVINTKQHDNLEYNIHSVWELKKNSIFSSLDVKNGDDIFLMNVATGQHIAYHRNSRKAKFSLVSESYKLQITDDKYRFKLPDGNFLGCRRNHAEDKYQIGFQQTDSYFIIEQVNVHTNKILSKVNEIYRVLKSSYKCIWLWGLEKQGNKNQVDYNFNRAARDEYLLKIQITILNQVLEQIDAILCEQDESSHRLCQFQNLIKKSKILEILIYFCKLFLIKRQPIKKSKKNTQQRTVFMIAKRNIEPTLLLIIGVLRRSCKNNKQCSSIIIQFSSLFNSLLTIYPEEVGSMLKQSIKNLSMLNLNYKGEELFQWVKLLEKPRKQNIQTLNIYISIVSEVVIDPFDRGIQAYQVKCVQFLFNLHGNMKMKNFLLSFHLNEKQEPIIQFSYASQKQLLANNPVLQQVVCDDEKAYCSLISLSNRSKNNPSLNSYLIYVYQVIRLYRNLCKDRNKKMSIQMQSIGIKQPLIVKIIRSESIDAKLKMAFLSLYLQIYIDQDPYVPFTKHQNRCLKYQSIPSKNLNSKTYFIFNPSTQSKSSIQLSQFIISFIDGYIATSLNELQSGQHISQSMCIHIIYIIKFIKASVDFGYFQANIIIFKIQGLLTLLLLLLQKISNHEEYQNYVATIVLQMTDFLWLYKRITVQLSIMSFMKVCYIQTKQQFTSFLRQNTTDMIKYFLSSYLTLQKRKIRTQQDKDLRQDIKRSIDNNFRTCQQKIQSFLLQILISLHTFKNKPFYQTFMKTIDKNVLIHLEIQKQLQNYEIVIGKDQIKIADELNNNHSTRILNANKLEQQVSKLIGQQEITCEQRTTLIIEISNLIRKIIKKLGQYRVKGKQIVNVAQRIIEKNQTFNSVKKILIQCSSNKQFKQLILIIHHFLYEMILDNPSLTIKICSEISSIIRVLNSVYIPKIIFILFPNAPNKKAVFTEINNTMIFKPHIRQAGFKAMRAALKSLPKQERKQLIKIVITTLFLSPSFKKYLDINQISHETRQFIKLLIFLLKNNEQLRKQMRDIFAQRDIEAKMVDTAYQNKSIYLQLLLHIHFVNPVQQQYVSEHTLIRLILPQLQNFFIRINEFSDQRLLNHMKQNDERNDPSQVQQKYRDIKDIIHNWKINQFKEHQQNIKKRTTKKRTYLMVEQTQNFWEFFYSWDEQKYYLVTFVKEALQLGILKICNYQNQFNEPNSTSLLRSKKERQVVKQQLVLAKHISDIGNVHEPNTALNNKFAKTQPLSFKQFQVYKPYQEVSKIKQSFRQIACLISRLIIKYNLRSQEIVKFNNNLSWICILLGQSSIFVEDRCLIDKIFKQSELTKYKSSKTQSTYLEKIFYLVGKMLYKNVSVTDIFQVFNVQKNDFIKYTDQQQSKTKSEILQRKDFVLKMQILYQKSQFQLVEPVKLQNLTQEQQQTYKQIQQTEYIFKSTRINFFNQLYSQLSKTSGFKQNQYWFIKKLLDILRCLKNKHLQQIIKDGKKQLLDYERDYWEIYQWIFDLKEQVLQNLSDNKHLKLEQYAQKFNQIIMTKITNPETTPQIELQSLFVNFTGMYTVHYQNSFMDRLMLVYFDIINKQNIKINIPTSLMVFILERLIVNHSGTILQIIRMFFVLAKTKFVGAQIDFEILKKNIYAQLKYIQMKLIQSNIEGQVKILQYFNELIKVIESFRQLPSTNNKDVITFMNQNLLQMLEKLSINKKHPHLIFKTTIFYLEQIEENIINLFQCKSFVSYIYQEFHEFPINIYVISLNKKEDMHNLALFFAVPRKLRSLKMYKYLYKMIQSSGLKYPFLKLMGGFVNWSGRQPDVQQKNQIGDEFALDVHHRLIMLFEISYQMYHMNYENFRELIQPQIKYLQLYSQARLKTDELTKQIKTKNSQSLQFGQQAIIEAFQFYINSNCRIQIMKNQKPIEIFFTKPAICYHFNDDIKEQALKEIDKHHKQNLHQYINQISLQVTNSLKIQESLNSFQLGRFTIEYQKKFQDAMYFVMLLIFVIMLIIQSTNMYQYANNLRMVIGVVFFFRFIQYIVKIGNLLRGYCKFKQRWCVSFLKQMFGFVYITQFLIIIICLFASVFLQLYSIAFFLETLLCRSIREYIHIIISQYIVFIKFLLFIIATCIFGSLVFAYYHGDVNLPIQYFSIVLKAMLDTKNQNSDNHLQYTGQMIIYYMSQYIFCILFYTLMSAIIGTTVQTNSKPYLYNCLICLKPKQTFAIKGSATFKKHIIQQHNFWNYLFYFIHLETKQNQIKTVDDLYVEKCIKEKNWMFLKM